MNDILLLNRILTTAKNVHNTYVSFAWLSMWRIAAGLSTHSPGEVDLHRPIHPDNGIALACVKSSLFKKKKLADAF